MNLLELQTWKWDLNGLVNEDLVRSSYKIIEQQSVCRMQVKYAIQVLKLRKLKWSANEKAHFFKVIKRAQCIKCQTIVQNGTASNCGTEIWVDWPIRESQVATRLWGRLAVSHMHSHVWSLRKKVAEAEARANKGAKFLKLWKGKWIGGWRKGIL